MAIVTRYMPGFVILLSTILNASPALRGAEPLDHFDYSLEGAFGFCAEEGDIFRASIRAIEEGGATRFEFRFSELVEGEAGDPDCLPPAAEAAPCFKERELPPRALSREQAEEFASTVESALTELREKLDPICFLIDLCRVNVFEIDTFVFSDNPCDEPHLPFEAAATIVEALEALRDVSSFDVDRNGDVNDDRKRDISDAAYLLSWLFLGGLPPLELGVCGLLADCAGVAIERPNGDTNGDGSRDLADAIFLLNWLFSGGPKPVPLCECGPPVPCDDCPAPARCVPDSPTTRVCTADLETCEDVRAVYDLITLDIGRLCDGEACHVLIGHCGMGLGGCFYALSTRISAADLDALASRFRELECFGPVCRCTAPPEGAECREASCEFILDDGRDEIRDVDPAH